MFEYEGNQEYKANKFNRLKYILLLVIGITFASCTNDSDSDSAPVRVLLAYIGTDNNLSGYEQGKLQELRNGWSGNPTDYIIAYVDKGKGAAARLIEISNLAAGEQPREIATYGNVNSASANMFSQVISDVKAVYPADSYGLLLFSHASGWLPSGALNNPSAVVSPQSRSIVIDGKNEMALADFAAAIPDGFFDYIAFEACFMAGIEVAYELRRKAPYIFASSAEIIHPGFEPVYAEATSDLIKGNLAAFGKKLFEQTLAYPEDDLLHSATYSLIRTAGLEALGAFIKSHCDFTQSPDISAIQHFDRLNGYRLFFDFEDYYARLLSTDVQKQELKMLLSACIGWKAATPEFMTQQSGNKGFAITYHSGLTTYILQDRFGGLNEAYTHLEWSRAIY